MKNNKTIIAIIPARAGSKGLPNKNIRMFCGKPLIGWTIEAGLSSQYIDELIVSTDSQEIAEVARELGAVVPFIRPSELATDIATSMSVIDHALNFYKKTFDRTFDYIVLLEPTSPLRTTSDIDDAIAQLLSSPKALAVVGICKTETQHPAFLVEKDSEGFLAGYENNNMQILRRQEISDVYFFEGSIYASETSALLEKKTFYHETTIGYVMPKSRAIEIDDIYDFVMAEALMNNTRLS
jgi:CMP-N,N'-diacetyllegionaminic acid synthase